MDGYQYERKCAELLKAKGFSDVQVTPGSGDQGIDVIAYQSKKNANTMRVQSGRKRYKRCMLERHITIVILH